MMEGLCWPKVASAVTRCAFAWLLTAAVAAFPAAASALADFTPSLVLTQSGTTAGSNPTIGFDAKFTSTTGDSVKSDTFTLPPGLLGNESIDGGACLLSSTPTPACQVGTGVLTLASGGGPVSQSVTVDLVKPPNPADIGGLAFVSGTTPVVTADVTLGATGANVVFSNLPAGITAISSTLTNLRLPTSCPTPAANVTLTAVSVAGVSSTATAPLNVTGCGTEGYAPSLAASITKDSKGQGATLSLDITQAATEAANQTITLGLGKAVTPNISADVPCLTGSGSGCTIGTATATSPLFPGSLSGTVSLSGTATAPVIAITFPAPFALTIDGLVDLANNSVTFKTPDVPLTTFGITVNGPNGPNGQKSFNVTSCGPTNVTGSFTGQGGQMASSTAPITLSNCAVKPTVSGSLSGLAAGNPALRFKATQGKGAAKIASVAVKLPAALKFSHSAFTTSKTCVTEHGKKKCTTSTLIKGLGVSGATAESVALKGGKLDITLKKAAASVTVNLSGPVLTESGALQTAVKKHKGKSLTVTVTITDASSTSTSVPLKLKAH
jgi:hypothetical protein